MVSNLHSGLGQSLPERESMTPDAASPAASVTPEVLPSPINNLHRLLVDRVVEYAIFALDPQGYILTWNAGAERLKQYTATEAIGRHFSMFYPAEDLAAGKTDRELEIAKATGRVEDEGWRLRKDGSRFWANVLITALRDDAGTLVGFAKVTRDMTERRLAEQRAIEDARRLAIQEAARDAAEERAHEMRAVADRLRSQALELERRSGEAEEANRAKSEFLAAMSHELRTPLNAIGGYTQLMQMGVSGPVTHDQLDHLERIQRSQQHLLGIINDILNFSRIEAGQITYDVGPVPLKDVMESVRAMLAVQVESRHLKLVVAPCSHTALADRSKVEQILINLISNSVKFTEEGSIEMECIATTETTRISVRDSGIGIPANQLDQIFAPFVQVGRGLASPKEGAGLGLAISRDLARAMGGDLVAESVEGVGSTFTLVLPRAKT
jgi:PAS domain S-box-containing protein